MEILDNLIDKLSDKLSTQIAEKMKKIQQPESGTQVFIDFDNLIVANPSSNSYTKVEMTIPDLQSYSYVSVQSCVIPKNYYLIEEEFATLTISDTISTVTIAVGTGNYSYITLKTAMLDILNTNPITSSFGVWDITFDRTTSRYTFLCDRVNLRFEFASNSSLARCLGFDLYETHYFADGRLTSDHPLFLQRTNSVIIRSNIPSSKISSGISADIFLNIPDTSPVNSPIYYVNNDIYQTKQKINAIGNTFYLYLVDDSDHPLNPNAGSNINLILFKD